MNKDLIVYFENGKKILSRLIKDYAAKIKELMSNGKIIETELFEQYTILKNDYLIFEQILNGKEVDN